MNITKEELSKLAFEDSQLNCFNRNHYEKFQKPIKAHVALIDVNNLKAMNDKHKNHAFGDLYLKSIVQTLKVYGTATRLGGDEFLVVFTSKQHRLAFEEAEKSDFRIATATGYGTIEKILSRLDIDMYLAKQRKRRC